MLQKVIGADWHIEVFNTIISNSKLVAYEQNEPVCVECNTTVQKTFSSD